jgi:hypothetical protein
MPTERGQSKITESFMKKGKALEKGQGIRKRARH